MKFKVELFVMVLALLLWPFTVYLVPEFDTWSLFPKFRIKHLPLYELDLTWGYLYVILFATSMTIGWFLMELRRRRCNEILGSVMDVWLGTSDALSGMDELSTTKASLQLLDDTSGCYDKLLLVQNSLQKKRVQYLPAHDTGKVQPTGRIDMPPQIEDDI